MTNEEKAREIIGGGCNKQNCSECGGSLSVAEGCVEFRHLKEMAEWKEKQMMEKACTIYQNELKQFAQLLKIVSGKNTSGLIDIEKSVDEFKKAMEG